jgi:molybdenum cofactor cytidylyltransferase
MSKFPFSAVLLAAGSSTRMEGELKQLLPLPVPSWLNSSSATAEEEPAVRITARALLAAEPEEVVVVTGHRGREVMQAVADLSVTLTPNPRHQQGQMTSVLAGLSALSAPCSAVMICLADMVAVTPEDYKELAHVFAELPRDAILIPFHNGRRGNPVMFAASRVPEVLSGAINPGCRKLIEDHPMDVVRHEFGHNRFATDMDTPQDYQLVRAHLAQTLR